jgi:hypothetical protein
MFKVLSFQAWHPSTVIFWHTTTEQLGSILKTTYLQTLSTCCSRFGSLLLKQKVDWKLGMLALMMYIERLFHFSSVWDCWSVLRHPRLRSLDLVSNPRRMVQKCVVSQNGPIGPIHLHGWRSALCIGLWVSYMWIDTRELVILYITREIQVMHQSMRVKSLSMWWVYQLCNLAHNAIFLWMCQLVS